MHIDTYAYFLSRFWVHRWRGHPTATSLDVHTTAGLGQASAIYLEADDERHQQDRFPAKSNVGTIQEEGNQNILDEQGQSSQNSQPQKDEEPVPVSTKGEAHARLSVRQKGKQKAIQFDPISSRV